MIRTIWRIFLWIKSNII